MRLLITLLVLVVSHSTFAQRMFADTPENHYGYETFAEFKKRGIGFERAFEGGGRVLPRPGGTMSSPTFENFAIETERTVLNLKSRLTIKLGEFSSVPFNNFDLEYYSFKLTPELCVIIDLFFEDRPLVEKNRLRHEVLACSPILDKLVSLGRKAQLEESDMLPFADVPKGHWASEAVQGLGLEGLLRGYPTGNFRETKFAISERGNQVKRLRQDR